MPERLDSYERRTRGYENAAGWLRAGLSQGYRVPNVDERDEEAILKMVETIAAQLENKANRRRSMEPYARAKMAAQKKAKAAGAARTAAHRRAGL